MSERIRFNEHDLYYPVGNTRSLDITHGCEVAEECDMLFLGCGDIRNVLHTIHVLHRNGTTKSEGQIINIHLNDVENGVLSRDLILLYLVRTIDPANDEDLRFMWGIWYDCLLSQDHSQRLQHVLKQLSTVPISSFDVYFGNLQTESCTRKTLRSWMNAEITGRLTSDKREAFIRNMYQDYFPETAVQRIASRLTRLCDHLMSTPRLKDRLYQEIREFVVTGVSRVNSAPLSSERVIERFCGNTTFFRPGYEQMWKVEDNCCPLLCYDVDLQLDRYDGKLVTMSSLCLAILKQWVESYQAAIKEGCIIKVHLWQGEATVLCETGLPENLHFDFIDTSNIGDWLGLIPVLIYCRDRLKRPDGIVGTQIFHWHQRASSVMEFLQSCFDIPVLMYPTVFGFHLAEELSLGHESLPDSGSYVGVGMIYLIWKVGREERELSELTILHDDAVSDALHKLLKPCIVGDLAGRVIAKPSAFDMEAREHVMTRIKGISKTMEMSTADVQSTNTQIPSSKQRTIVEYMDHYRVTITTDPECLKEGKFTVEHARGDPNLVVLINTQRGKPSFRKILRVSCGISINSSKITLSRKRGKVDARLVKDVNTTVGEGVLPWKKVELDSASDLPDFPPSKYGESIIDTYITQVWPFQPTDTIEAPNAVEQLQWLLWYLFKNMRESFGVPQLLRLGVSNLAKPSQRANNRFHLKGLKMQENMPTLFLEFFDFDKAEELVKQQKLTICELAPFYVRLGDYQEMDAAFCANLTQGYDLLVKILELNSHRITQHQSENKRWILRTVLRGRYPFQGKPEPTRPDMCQLM
ncbi:uncharacterized protein LOC124286812 isoform X2 [Haliotis rubra]|uniref:uncharacterized protein LOC124286812 isoform X2 n=1 Tax=Haliotis rubra TaxID=36100 RepID=UPI001EE505B8|nr:uncharacterized protein LOC124286812 isoform X2 [Haliotis rubra]